MLTADSSAISSIKLPNYVKVSACASKVRNNSYRPAYRLAVVNLCRVKCLPSILSDRFVLLLYNFNVKSLKRRFGEEKNRFPPSQCFPYGNLSARLWKLTRKSFSATFECHCQGSAVILIQELCDDRNGSETQSALGRRRKFFLFRFLSFSPTFASANRNQKAFNFTPRSSANSELS